MHNTKLGSTAYIIAITYYRGKTISIIGATMFNIVATIIIIVFTKIGVVYWGGDFIVVNTYIII